MPQLVAQRGSRHPVNLTAHQLYETPACATQALLKHQKLPAQIWEPCAGRGAISRLLTADGHHVWASDIADYAGHDGDVFPGIDFFSTNQHPDNCQCIVTNPPFKDGDRFVRHALTLVHRVVVLMRLAAVEGSTRSDLIDGHLTMLWIGIQRLPMMHREGWKGRHASQATPFAWFVFDQKKRGRAFKAERISWRD